MSIINIGYRIVIKFIIIIDVHLMKSFYFAWLQFF